MALLRTFLNFFQQPSISPRKTSWSKVKNISNLVWQIICILNLFSKSFMSVCMVAMVSSFFSNVIIDSLSIM